uniref:Uncharacterized protein n=1 Tax=Knipowitschia caucasica TaxID=637954 RepID=A0AAV2MLW4_KNICA
MRDCPEYTGSRSGSNSPHNVTQFCAKGGAIIRIAEGGQRQRPPQGVVLLTQRLIFRREVLILTPDLIPTTSTLVASIRGPIIKTQRRRKIRDNTEPNN